jgi:hypothetical protein
LRHPSLAPISIVLFFAACPALAQTGPSSSVLEVPGYLAELDRWGEALMQAKRNRATVAGFRKELPERWVVSVDGELITVPTDWLRAELESIEKNPRMASSCEVMQKRLHTLRAEALRLDQAPAISLAPARAELARILQRKEFRGVGGPTWLDRLKERIAGWIFSLLERLFGIRGVSLETRRVIVYVLFALCVLFMAAWMVRRLISRQAPVKLALEFGRPAAKSWQERAREAFAAAERGDFRDAVRLAYWAGVYRLEELGLWKTDRTRTHREYLRLLPSTHPQRDTFAELTRRFELIWYAFRDPSLDEFEAVVQNLEKLGCAFPWKPATGRS